MKSFGLLTVVALSITIISGCTSGIALKHFGFEYGDFVSSSKNSIDIKVSDVKSAEDAGRSFYVLEITNSQSTSINVLQEDIRLDVPNANISVPLYVWKKAVEDQIIDRMANARLQAMGTGTEPSGDLPIGEVTYESGFTFGEIPSGTTKKGHIRFNMDYGYMHSDLLKKLNAAKTAGTDVSKGIITIYVNTNSGKEEFSFPVKLMYREIIM